MLIKYTGSAHVRSIEKGDTAGGRLADPLPTRLEWNLENGHLLNTDDYPNVPQEWWDFLVGEDSGFRDVSSLKRIPVSEGQKLWQGLQDRATEPNLVSSVDDEESENVGDASATTTTTGGSTAGGGRATGGGGRAGRTTTT